MGSQANLTSATVEDVHGRAKGPDTRLLKRVRGPGRELVSATLRFGGQSEEVEVINYHFKGACLRVTDSALGLLSFVDAGDLTIQFRIGKKTLPDQHRFRIAWVDTESRTLGVELFQNERHQQCMRAPRYRLSRHVPCTLTCQDPTYPARMLYLRVEDLSMTGMCLSTSLTNAHILPGMSLKGAKLHIPGRGEFDVEVYIENTRQSPDADSFLAGVSIQTLSAECRSALGLFIVSMQKENNRPEILRSLKDSDLLGKTLRSGLTFRFVDTEEDYGKVLDLRYIAYAEMGKIGVTREEFHARAEGLKNEGLVIAAHIGTQLVATAELRFTSLGHDLRTFGYPGMREAIEKIAKHPVCEMNKLAIHPDAQGTDAFLGCIDAFQTIVYARGEHDLCFVATEELVSLYQRAGWRTVEATAPHPVRKGSLLQLMWMPVATYTRSSWVNPLVWERIFQASHEFHTALGLASGLTKGVGYTLRRIMGMVIIPIQETLRRRARRRMRALSKASLAKRETGPEAGRDAAQNDGTPVSLPDATRPHGEQAAESSGAEPIRTETYTSTESTKHGNSSLTEMHLHVGAVASYLKECDLLLGTATTESILNSIGLARSYFRSGDNWVSVGFLDAFLDAYSAHGDTVELSRKAARRAISRDELGVRWFVLPLLSTESALEELAKTVQKFNRTRTCEVVMTGEGRAVVHFGLTDASMLPKHRASCENIKECLRAYLELLNKTKAEVTQTECIYDGHPRDTYELKWPVRTSAIGLSFDNILWQLGGVGVGALAVAYFGNSGTSIQAVDLDAPHALLAFIMGPVLANFGRVSFARFKEVANAKGAAEALHSLVERDSRRFQEVQDAKEALVARVHEARLLEQMFTRIQALEGVGDIVSLALRSICTDFRFDRAILMMIEHSGSDHLKTVAVEGLEKVPEALWAFRVDVTSKRENPLLLSSVFHGGQPVLINEVGSHTFQLNENSRALIDALKSNGFIMVPIATNLQKRGVLIADRIGTDRKKVLTSADVRLLQRVANVLAVALDKEERLEEQRALRAHFERYVPSSVISAAMRSPGAVVMGGTQRTISAMFVDVREFTRTTERMSPLAVVTFVNRIFAKLEGVVRAHGGRVDKFLGDGMLAVWGSLEDLPHGCAPEALEAACEILETMPLLNDDLAQHGFPSIRLGIGLHTGEALVGHVGGETRCEFTCMGAAVNMAARMEGLCKSLDAALVVSDPFLSHATSAGQGHGSLGMEAVTGIEVRGFSGEAVVHCIRTHGVSWNTQLKESA